MAERVGAGKKLTRKCVSVVLGVKAIFSHATLGKEDSVLRRAFSALRMASRLIGLSSIPVRRWKPGTATPLR
jgi:hypothetical protein